MSGDLLLVMMLRVESRMTSVRRAGGPPSSLRQPSSQPSSSSTRVCFSYRPTALETAPRPRSTSGRMVVLRTTVIGQDDTPIREQIKYKMVAGDYLAILKGEGAVLEP